MKTLRKASTLVLFYASISLMLLSVARVEAIGKRRHVTFRIWIGVEGEDVVLTSPDYFEVVTSVSGWYPDEDGKSHAWRIPLYEDRYGYYDMNPIYSERNCTYLTDFYKGELAQLGWLIHNWQPGEYDDWTVDINWNAGDLDGDGVDDPYFLDGWTALRTPEAEGTYDPITDTWTVTFSNAHFDIDWWECVCTEQIGRSGRFRCICYQHIVWDGYLTFTVTIQKMP